MCGRNEGGRYGERTARGRDLRANHDGCSGTGWSGRGGGGSVKAARGRRGAIRTSGASGAEYSAAGKRGPGWADDFEAWDAAGVRGTGVGGAGRSSGAAMHEESARGDFVDGR